MAFGVVTRGMKNELLCFILVFSSCKNMESNDGEGIKILAEKKARAKAIGLFTASQLQYCNTVCNETAVFGPPTVLE